MSNYNTWKKRVSILAAALVLFFSVAPTANVFAQTEEMQAAATAEEPAAVKEQVEAEPAAAINEEVVIAEANDEAEAAPVKEEAPAKEEAPVKSEAQAPAKSEAKEKAAAPAAEDKTESAIPPMEANQKMLTGVRLGDGKAGNGDGLYYCLAYTDTFKAIDSRYIPFETKLNSSQYEAADYDFTDQLLTYKGETYAYRPNGPVAGDGKDFHYYTIKFMKVDKLAKSTYGGGYLVEGGHPSSWKLVTDLKKDANTGLYKAGYYHRDYQATLHVGDALDAYDVVEEPIVEEPVIEEPVVEEPVIEEPVIEQPVEEPIVEEPIIEEIVAVPAEGPADPEAAVEPAADEQEAAPAAKAAETEKAAVAKTVETQNAVSARNEMTAKGAATRGTVSLSETVAPQAAPAQMTVIDDDAAPQAGFESQWALMNLVSAVLTILVGMTAMIKSLRNRKGAASIANLLPALVAIVIFALTENVTGAMALTDQWTIPMLAVLAIGGVFSIMGIGRENEE